MINMIKAELMKERRGANAKLKFLTPIIFVLFNILMLGLIGESPSGKSYLMATSFNWYPVMILPIVLSLFVLNILSKEKDEHLALQRRLNLTAGKLLIAKNVVVVLELLFVLSLSSTAIYLLGHGIVHDDISVKNLSVATVCLFTGSLPVIALSFLISKVFKKKILVIIINFLCSFLSAIIAPTSYWMIFPWAYSLRILSPVIGVHPNGTFLEQTSPLMAMNSSYFGLMLCLIVYLFVNALSIWIERRRQYV